MEEISNREPEERAASIGTVAQRENAGGVTPRGVSANEEHADVGGGGGDLAAWAHALENLRAAEDARAALDKILKSPSTLYVDKAELKAAGTSWEAAEKLKTQERRIEALQAELTAAVTSAAEAKAALRQSEEVRAQLGERVVQMERELEATSGVFEVYTSELRARQLEVEKRCEEVRVLQGVIRNLNGGNTFPSASPPTEQ